MEKSVQDAAVDRLTGGQQPIFISVPESSPQGIDLVDLWRTLFAQKWLVIVVASVFVCTAVAYALLATPIYRAEVVLAPVAENQSSSKLGGLASLAGINIDLDSKKIQAIALLRSRVFIERFIVDENLLPILFADRWDAANKRWLASSVEEQPDIRDAVKFFAEQVRFVTDDVQTGLITVAIEWTDPRLAADWAAELVTRINHIVRYRDIQEYQKKLEYLNAQLSAATLLEVRQAIAEVVEEQINAITLAYAQTEYVFKVIDPAVVPKEKISPKRTLIVVIAGVFGLFFGMILALIRSSWNRIP
jgi:uncharacterized protein involved in exopolysaccharide biosynthesis